ncbi:hypothetical protein [Natrinema altunense]|uniref:Uncharacterized protein n=2 Tax=Natrinema altunense TaxID=222984 RepID=L9ZXZ2_NATA2|nr:hypothetical protein [Natrinema altunense]ELY91184.1 hypothetical protein C485_02244 [Natrinema altunense JCM 12890]
MDLMDLFQTLTLWFVLMIFLRTGSGNAGLIVTASAYLAIILVLVLPVFLLLVGLDELSGGGV